MLEECVLTPIPSASQRSSVSLLVSPSSLASSCTRFLLAKCLRPAFAWSWGDRSDGARAARRDEGSHLTAAVPPRANPGSARFASSVLPGGQPTALGWRALTRSVTSGARRALERGASVAAC